jgi:DNA-binding XRE family transcriptional regulator
MAESRERENEQFNGYLHRIEISYVTGNAETRRELMKGLGAIVEGLEEESGSVFDPIRARRLRESAGYTKAALAEEVEVEPTYIIHWEKGRRVPSPLKKGSSVEINTGTIGYLKWLRGQGYDPYNLSEIDLA